MIKVEDHYYTKHLSQFLFSLWSHELFLLWLLEFIAELLKPKMSFAQICLNFSFNFNTFAFEEPASVFPSSGSPPAPPSSRSSLRIPEKDWMQSSISKDFDSLLRIHLLEGLAGAPDIRGRGEFRSSTESESSRERLEIARRSGRGVLIGAEVYVL